MDQDNQGHDEDNLTLQREELEALSSIYEDDFVIEEEDPPTFTVTIRLTNGQKEAFLMISFGPDYPKNAPPIYQLSVPWIRGSDKKYIAAQLDELYLDHMGENIVYIWVEKLREVLEERENTTPDDANDQEQPLSMYPQRNPISDKLIASVSRLNCSDSMANNQNTRNNISENSASATAILHSPLSLPRRTTADHNQQQSSENYFTSSSKSSNHYQTPVECKVLPPEITTGEPFTDRKSTFQAHLAPINDVSQVRVVLEDLYKNKKIASATHNMYAYRIFKQDTSSWTQDCEDDGETHAGSRLLHLLQILECRNVLVVVTRWYGGIQLHADRFKHINNVARQLLEQHGYISVKKK